MFFFEMEAWREYAEELGINQVIRDLEAKGRPAIWVTSVVDPGAFGAVYEAHGKPHYRSGCPGYEGYWLHGGTGAVQCSAYSGLCTGHEGERIAMPPVTADTSSVTACAVPPSPQGEGLRELLPGVVWYNICGKGWENCPFRRKGEFDDGRTEADCAAAP